MFFVLKSYFQFYGFCLLEFYVLMCYQYYFLYLFLISCCSIKYDFVLDEQVEDLKLSYFYISKKYKKKIRYCFEEKEDEDYMLIKNINQVFLTFSFSCGGINMLFFCQLYFSSVIQGVRQSFEEGWCVFNFKI